MTTDNEQPDHTDIPLTEGQAQILRSLEEQAARANRDREVALTMALAGAGIATAKVLGLDLEARVLRVQVEHGPPG